MNFDLSSEQTLLQESLQKFAARHAIIEGRRTPPQEPSGLTRAAWSELSNMGVLALPFAEADGGLGGSPVDWMIVMQELGRALATPRIVASVIMAGDLLAGLGSDEQKQRWLGPILQGKSHFALAHAEERNGYAIARVETMAHVHRGGYRLRGHKRLVLGGAEADAVIVSARTSGERDDPQGISLFIVPSAAPGVERRDYRLVDGSIASSLRFDDVVVDPDMRLGEEGAAHAALENMTARTCVALCAEAVGIMEELLNRTLDYLRTRKQFGVAIGSFQAIQHRMAECYAWLEQSRSIVLKAVLCSEAERRNWLRHAAAAKALVSRAARRLGEEAVQFHGAMGVTDELIISHYHKRLWVIQTLFGDVSEQLVRYESLRCATEH
jgi:alkylation response protein AidB-like acyl-CoA dehydrogenase